MKKKFKAEQMAYYKKYSFFGCYRDAHMLMLDAGDRE